MTRRNIDVKCPKCGSRVFRYHKNGKGNLQHCWIKRIIRDESIRDGLNVYCCCGNLIGVEENDKIKLK